MTDLWSYALTLLGVAGTALVGRKVWWAQHFLLITQIPWTAFALVTGQFGFLLGVVLNSAIYVSSAREWQQQRPQRTPAPTTAP